MQHGVSLYSLQTDPGADDYAVVNGYRISVDVAQATVHFYRGEQEWGRLAGSVPVDKWTGDWLIRSVGRFFRLAYQLSEHKPTASIQRNGYLTVRTVHQIGKATLYERLLANNHWDYAVSFRNEVGFGQSAQDAIAVVRNQLKSRTQEEQSTITLQIGPASRFTQAQLLAFCSANGLTPGGRYTRQQLRQTVLQQRKLNCEQFRSQLSYFDIRINCK